MKKIYLLSILCTGILLAACGGENTDPVEPVEPKPEPETRTLTFVLPEDGTKTAWEAGDAIVVHGEYAADEVTVTLSAGDISSDKKSASKEVSGLYPYVSDECSSTLYASWPASASANLRHCFYYSGFSHANSPLMAACNKDDTFTFRDFTSRITFTVSGDFEGYTLNGRKDAPVGYEFFQVKITDKEVNLNQFHERPLVNVSGEISGDGSYTIYVPGAISLPKGYVLMFLKDGKAIKAVTDKGAYEVPQGGVLDLGDVTDRLEDFAVELDTGSAVDLSADGTANCYQVTEPGVYKFPSVKGNTSESVGYVETVKVLWETWNNTEEVTKKSVVKTAMYENSYIYFEIPEGFHAGNALLAALDEEDVILWSWHIWVPETPFSDLDGTDFCATKVMSRNVGALKDTPAGVVAPMESWGMLYQFGRKDPFPGGATVAGTAITVQEGQVSYQEATQNPTVFNYLAGKDWQNEGADVAKKSWESGSTKTVNDPCPAGYRLQGRDKTYLVFNSDLNLYGQSNCVLDETLHLITAGAQVFPLAGIISDEDGTYIGGGTDIILWSNHYDSGTENAYAFAAPNLKEKTEADGTITYEPRYGCKGSGNIRSKGGSARCMKM